MNSLCNFLLFFFSLLVGSDSDPCSLYSACQGSLSHLSCPLVRISIWLNRQLASVTPDFLFCYCDNNFHFSSSEKTVMLIYLSTKSCLFLYLLQARTDSKMEIGEQAAAVSSDQCCHCCSHANTQKHWKLKWQCFRTDNAFQTLNNEIGCFCVVFPVAAGHDSEKIYCFFLKKFNKIHIHVAFTEER